MSKRQWNSGLRRWGMVLGLVGALGLLSGCGRKDGVDAGPRGTAENPWVFGFSQCTLNEPWRVEMNRQVQLAAEKYPEVKLLMANAEDKSERQVNDVENFLAQGVDLIIISPKEAAPLTDIVAKAYKQGTPVVVLDRKVLGEDYSCFIGANNQKIGYQAGLKVKALLAEGGKVVELTGNMSSTPGEERQRGFREAIAEELASGKIEILHDADCDWKEERARSEMEAALAAHERIDLVYGHNDPMAHGAWLAASQQDRAEGIHFVGIDGLPNEGVSYVREGILTATFEYPTGGAEAIDAGLALMKGEPVEKVITLGTRIYTKENVSAGGEAID